MTKKPKKLQTRDDATGHLNGVQSSTSEQLLPPALLKDVRQLIEAARARAAAAVNSEMVRLYWSIGERIRKDILAYERATYGEQIVHALSRQLSEEYGPGFGRTNLFYVIALPRPSPTVELFTHRVNNYPGTTSGRSFTSTTHSSVSSTPNVPD